MTDTLAPSSTAADIEILRAQLIVQMAQSRPREERLQLMEEVNRWLKAQLFARSSEKTPADERNPDQARLFNEAEAITAMKRDVDEFLSAGTHAADATYDVAARTGRNDVTWTLDAQGRPLRAEATLREVFVDASRSSAETGAQRAAAGRGLPDDVGGHIVAHRFVLDQGAANVFPQNIRCNNSAYRTMENEWAAWIQSGKEVRIRVDLIPQGQARPDQIAVTYDVVDPATTEVIYTRDFAFRNEAGQDFDRVFELSRSSSPASVPKGTGRSHRSLR